MNTQVVKKVTVTQQDPTLVQAGNVQTETVTRNSPPFSDFFVSKTNQVIFAIIGIIDLLLLLRVVFFLLGANQVGIVSFIINLTQVFVAPFAGIFSSPSSGSSFIDVASILAIIIYIVLGIILGEVINLFSSKTE